MKKIRISSDALSDLNDGFLFYEKQAQGLGDYFTSSLRSDIEELKVTGGSHRLIFRDFQRSLSRIFPYGTFYTLQAETVTEGEAVPWTIIPVKIEKMKSYTAVVEKCLETGLYVGYVPGIAGAHFQGESLDELKVNLEEVLSLLRDGGGPCEESEFVGTQLFSHISRRIGFTHRNRFFGEGRTV